MRHIPRINMGLSCLIFPLCVALLELPAPAQIGYPGGRYPGGYPGGYPPGGYPPGGYPPGGYPGGGYPYPGGGGVGFPAPRRRGKQDQNKNKDAEDRVNVSGLLRKLDDSSLIVQAQDTRIITLKRTSQTKFQRNSKDIKPSILKPGDHLRVEAHQDDQGYLYALTVVLEKQGTEQERAAASQPVEAPTAPASAQDGPETPGLGGAEPTHADDPDIPVLRRKTPKDSSASPDSAESLPPAAGSGPAAPEKAGVRSADDDVASTTKIESPPSLPNEDESDRPRLRRGWSKGKPLPEPDDGVQSAPNRPAIKEPIPRTGAQEPRETFPASAGRSADPVIEKARAAAAEFTETLPDYVCEEQMTRFVNVSHVVNWQPVDIVSSEVVYEKGHERYRNLKVNGKPTGKRMEELGGAWSTGEFGSVLVDLLSPATAAEFEFRRESTAAGQPALVYDFSVEQEHSHWRIQVPSETVIPAYKGSVWIDKKTNRVLRIEMQARNMPREFPLDKVESAVDYEYVRLGSEKLYLLPVHAESLSCQRGRSQCSRNSIDFRNYHKYTSESEITFTDPK